MAFDATHTNPSTQDVLVTAAEAAVTQSHHQIESLVGMELEREAASRATRAVAAVAARKPGWAGSGQDAVATAKRVGNVAGDVFDAGLGVLRGSGKTAKGAVGGVLGFGNSVAQKAVKGADRIVNRSLDIVGFAPALTAIAIGVVTAIGLGKWWNDRKTKKAQETEIAQLDKKLSQGNERAQLQETSADLGQTNPTGRTDGQPWVRAADRSMGSVQTAR